MAYAKQGNPIMDIALARTFIEVVMAGNFVAAATRLNVTQSTVSMRIRSLEKQLGRRLFVRSKAGAALTPAGEQFQRYAVTLTQVWEQACHHIAVPPDYRAFLSVGCQFSLCDGLLVNWLPWMKKNAPDILLRAEYSQPDRLMRRLIEGALDIGVMYAPQSNPGLTIETLFEEKLVLVSAETSNDGDHETEYVYVDWGAEFHSGHSLKLPNISKPSMFLALGSLALQYVIENGCSAYFPERVVRPHLKTGCLARVKDAPEFSLPAYVVYATDGDKDLLNVPLEGLRRIVAQQLGR